MIHTAIGLETGLKRTKGFDSLQDWLVKNELQPYLPQLRHQESGNITLQWDCQKQIVKWPKTVQKAVLACPHPMVIHYNNFFYRERPDTFRFCGVSQDDLGEDELTANLAGILASLGSMGIESPWMFVDEPPPIGNPRWATTVEARIIKMVRCAIAANWTVGVAVPNRSSLAYWSPRMKPTRWILAAKNTQSEYQPTISEIQPCQIWLYNRRVNFSGLRRQMEEFGATGYLHWSVESHQLPLAVVTGDDYVILPAMNELLAELNSAASVTLESLDARVTKLEELLRTK